MNLNAEITHAYFKINQPQFMQIDLHTKVGNNKLNKLSSCV